MVSGREGMGHSGRGVKEQGRDEGKVGVREEGWEKGKVRR